MTTGIYTAFKSFSNTKKHTFTLSYAQFPQHKISMIDRIFEYCVRMLAQENGYRTPVPSKIPAQIREIIDQVHETGRRQTKSPKVRRGMTVRRPESENSDGVVLDMDRELCSSDLSVRDMRKHWDDRGPDHAKFVTSGAKNPNYVWYTPEQTDYYLYWRNCVLNGKYPITDTGYLNMFMCELTVIEADPEKVDGILKNLYEAYGGDDPMNFICKSRLEYEMAYGLDIRTPPKCITPDYTDSVMEDFLNGGKSEPTADMLLSIIGPDGDLTPEMFDDGILDVVLKALRKINLALGISSSDIWQELDMRDLEDCICLLDGFGYSAPICYNYRTYHRYDERFGTQLKKLMTSVLKEIQRVKDGVRTKPAKCMVFGYDGRNIIWNTVNDWWKNRPKRRTMKEAKDIKFDLEAVSEAESALNEVTEMMTLGCTAEQVKPKADRAAQTVDAKGWQGLAEALDDAQRGYLRACLDGKAKGYLKGTGSRMAMMEDSINSAATDAVGDSIVEDGAVVDDYVKDVSRMLHSGHSMKA